MQKYRNLPGVVKHRRLGRTGEPPKIAAAAATQKVAGNPRHQRTRDTFRLVTQSGAAVFLPDPLPPLSSSAP